MEESSHLSYLELKTWAPTGTVPRDAGFESPGLFSASDAVRFADRIIAGLNQEHSGALILKPVRWSPHAKEMLLDRDVELSEAEETLTNPDDILPADWPRVMYQRVYYDKMLGQEMMLRLVVEESPKEQVVVTIYKSSKLDKYRR